MTVILALSAGFVTVMLWAALLIIMVAGSATVSTISQVPCVGWVVKYGAVFNATFTIVSITMMLLQYFEVI